MSKTLFHKGRELRERLLRTLVPCPMSPAEASQRRQVRARLAELEEVRREPPPPAAITTADQPDRCRAGSRTG